MLTKTKVCRVCGAVLDDKTWSASRRNGKSCICKECDNKCHRQWREANPDRPRELLRSWREANPDKARAAWMRRTRKEGHLPFDKNKECSQYLGIHVAERVLSHVFKNVERLPCGNPGYDFICNHGKRIDVKSSCIRKNSNSSNWAFHINHNTIADFFLCLAFDNRESLTPLHVWLIPGNMVNNRTGVGISPSTIHRWDEYQLDISKVMTCCDTLRNQSTTTTESPSLKSPAATHSELPSR